MRRFLSARYLPALLCTAGFCASLASASPSYKDPAPLKFEHPGDLFRKVSGGSCCVDGVLTGANSTGEFKTVGGIPMYMAYPPSKKTNTAILYLTDIFGVNLVNNRLLGDSMAQAGYYVVMPDLFMGDPIPINAMGSPGFNMSAWREKHTTAMVDAIVESTIKSMRGELGVSKIGAVGYCFGGKYVARFLASGKGLDAGFTAHPSGVIESEWSAIKAPISIAFAENDQSSTPAQRASAESIFQKMNATYQTSLYSGAEHGFAVRTDLSDRRKRFAQEGAYFQAVRWFDAWVK